MSQDLTAKKPPSGASGTTCSKTGLYKATDGKMEFVELIRRGSIFPKFPGGNGTTNTTWTAVSESADGSRTSFTAVKVSAGTL